MKKFLLIQLFLGCIIPVNAGIYYYPFYQNGIKVRCGDNQPRHLISFKAGRAMLFEDDGDEKYKFPGTFLFPEKPDERYKYFPSTAGTKCSSRELSKEEREFYIKKAKDVCYGGDLSTRIKYCYGWNR